MERKVKNQVRGYRTKDAVGKRKLYSIIANLILLMWFTLDMVGVDFGYVYLVTRSWKEDGVFWIIFVLIFLFFILKEKIGGIILSIWLSIWLVTQFFSHEWFTIVGNGEGKIRYFEGSLQWIASETRYIPDVYHTILHILILIALITTVKYIVKSKSKTS